MRFIACVLLTITIATSCSTSERERELETPPSPTENAIVFDSTGTAIDTIAIAPDNKPIIVTLRCRKVSDDEADNPLYEVALIALDQRIPLDTIHACNTFTTGDYETYQIPASAVAACGGWYQGTGEYFYLTEDNADLVVHYAWLREEQTTQRYPYREVFRLKLPALEQ